MMWNNFLERGKELAEKAKAAAENLDKQLNVTVGIDDDGTAVSSSATNLQTLDGNQEATGLGETNDDALDGGALFSVLMLRWPKGRLFITRDMMVKLR